MSDPRLELVLNEIIIRSGLDQDGEYVYATKFTVEGTEDRLIPFVEGLGLLEAARIDFVERWGHRE